MTRNAPTLPIVITAQAAAEAQLESPAIDREILSDAILTAARAAVDAAPDFGGSLSIRSCGVALEVSRSWRGGLPVFAVSLDSAHFFAAR
jgi:hypothetical protein